VVLLVGFLAAVGAISASSAGLEHPPTLFQWLALLVAGFAAATLAVLNPGGEDQRARQVQRSHPPRQVKRVMRFWQWARTRQVSQPQVVRAQISQPVRREIKKNALLRKQSASLEVLISS
jgi:hypothetical protein